LLSVLSVLLVQVAVAEPTATDAPPQPSRQESSMRASAEWKSYEAVCGSCHLAFPPNLLPASAWQKTLGSLDNHFGQNANLSSAAAAQLKGFLTAWAGQPKPNSPLRITRTNWWLKTHDRIDWAVFERANVKSAANCRACHARAERGDFRSQDAKLPR